MEKIIDIKDFLDTNHIEYSANTSLAKKTWIRRGPIVPYFILPKNVSQLSTIVNFLHKSNKEFRVIGHTSNLYFKDTFKTEAIISTLKMKAWSNDDHGLCCEAGVSISNLAKACVEFGYLGYEGLLGLPGTVAAAIVNNSSCFKCCISELIEDVEVLLLEDNGTCSALTLRREDLGLRHRSSSIKRGEMKAVILKARLKANKTNDTESLLQKAQQNIEERKRTQEGKAMNLGSVFSGYHRKPIKMTALGWNRVARVFVFRVREHFFRNTSVYKLKRNHFVLKLFGYEDIEKYVSEKNINCFIWKDDHADAAFDRYYEFMHKYADCDALEIEIVK